jgi:hypothetical protein
MKKRPPCLGGSEEEESGVKVALKNLSLRWVLSLGQGHYQEPLKWGLPISISQVALKILRWGELCLEQCCGTGTAGTATFCLRFRNRIWIQIQHKMEYKSKKMY